MERASAGVGVVESEAVGDLSGRFHDAEFV